MADTSPGAVAAAPASSGRDNTFGVVHVRRVPRAVMRELSELADQRDMSREAFCRTLLSSVAAESALSRSLAEVVEAEEPELA